MMGNTDLNSAFSKARRFIALLAAFALSFSLLGTASIEAFAATVAGDGEQAGDYTAESTSTDLVYDSVYGVRHGGYALMDKVTDASTGAHRLDLVRGSDNAVTWSKSFTGENDEEGLTLTGYVNQFNHGFCMEAEDANGCYAIDLDGNDLLNGTRYDSVDISTYNLVVGTKAAANGSTTLTVYEIANGAAGLKGVVTLPNDVSDVDAGAWLEDDGTLWLWAGYTQDSEFKDISYCWSDGTFVETDEDPYSYDGLRNWTWPDGKQASLVSSSDNKVVYSLDGASSQVVYQPPETANNIYAVESYYVDSAELFRINWHYDGISDYGYYNEEGNKVEWLSGYSIKEKLSEDRYLASARNGDGWSWVVLQRGSNNEVTEVPLDDTAASYSYIGGLIFSTGGYGAVYDAAGSQIGVLEGYNNRTVWISPLGSGVFLGEYRNESTFSVEEATSEFRLINYDGSTVASTEPVSILRTYGGGSIDDLLLFAVGDDVSAMQVVDKNFNPISYEVDGKTYKAALCTESELVDYALGFADYNFPNSAIHTSANYNLIYVTENGKYGAVDKDGNIVVPVEYDAYFDSNAEDSNDTILVKKDGKWSFLKLGETETPSEQPGTDPSGEQPGEEPGEQGGTTTTTQTMFRLYNQNSGEHFYTANAGEKNNLVSLGWSDEGTGWIAPTSGDEVYRLYNPNAGEHHYTTNAAEKNMLVNAGWQYEGVGWYSGGDVRLYREYNPNAYANNHNYTTSKSEHDWLLSLGWRDEGYAWNAVSAK